MQPYVVQRLLNQRARIGRELLAKAIPTSPPSPLQSDSEEYDTDLDDESLAEKQNKIREEQKQEDSGVGSLVYKTICDQIASPAQSSIMQELATREVRIPERQMGPVNLTGLMCALLTNTRLTHLDLSHNHLGYDGGREISTVLMANNVITTVNLSDNSFGSTGVSAFLSKLLRTGRSIRELDISCNSFSDEDAKYLAAGLGVNDFVTILNMSHNNVSEDGAMYMGKAVAANDTLESLDLGWNCIRKKGAVTFCKALKRNTTLKKLNLSWNGLCYEGALAVADALKANRTLLEIDISNNRINWDGAELLADMLQHNSSLQVLKAGHNPLTTTGCQDIIDAVSGNQDSALKLLDLTEVPVMKDFLIIAKTINQTGRELETVYGEVVPHPDVLGERSERRIHPMQKIINYMYEKELRPLELLRSFDKDGKFLVTQDEFLERLHSKGIEIKTWEERELLEYVTGQGYGEQKGMVNYKKLADSVTNQIESERNIRMQQRDKSRSLRTMQHRILQVELPPLNVDSALVKITGLKSAELERNPHDMALRTMADLVLKRRTNSYESKMAMAKNIKVFDMNAHSTPLLVTTAGTGQDDATYPPRPYSRILMTSALSNIKLLKPPRSARGQCDTSSVAQARPSA